MKALNIELPYDQQFYFWLYTQKNWKEGHLHTRIYSSSIRNNQKVEATQVSVDG